MYPHDYCFYASCAFLLGIAAVLLGISPLFINCGVLLVAIGCFAQSYINHDAWMRGFGVCTLFAIIGCWYTGIRFEHYESVKVPYEEGVSFEGCISEESKITGSTQQARMRMNEPFNGDVLVRARSSELLSYGQCFHGIGVIKRPEDNRRSYFLKERLYGTIQYPKLSLMEKRETTLLGTVIVSARKNIMNAFQFALSRDEATFLAGLTIGAKGNFPDELQNAMKRSGTTHLVALSGYNIMIVISALMFCFGSFLKKRYAVIATGLFVFLFCLFAGGESSLMRAAILGCIGMIAGEVGRKFDIRQAIVVAAVLMAIINPFVLMFDIGFQLSFAAFLGIVYCSPALLEFFHINGENKILKLFIDAISAQLVTFPIIAMQFGTISVVGMISGIILLEFIPITMGFGFIAAFLSIGSVWLAFIPLLFARILLLFELWIIRLFGLVPFFEWRMNATFFLLYCAIIIAFVSIYLKRRDARLRIFVNKEK